MSRVVALTGGVGGAKLVLGLAHMMPPEDIVAVVNTGDDVRHLGLHVSPDIDTLLYTLTGRSDEVRGWGRRDESWNFMAALSSLGAEDWFNLGDGDVALHVVRTLALAQGESLSAVTARVARQWGLGCAILPMSDDPVATMLSTDEGELGFQRYFVARRCAPVVRRIRFEGAERAVAAPGVVAAILAAEMVLVAPSNPYLSVDPILAVPDLARALRDTRAPVVAVSPLIGGQAVKGPTAKLMGELGIPVDTRSIVAHYGDVLDAILLDTGDAAEAGDFPHAACDTLMRTLEDRERVARAALALGRATRRRFV